MKVQECQSGSERSESRWERNGLFTSILQAVSTTETFHNCQEGDGGSFCSTEMTNQTNKKKKLMPSHRVKRFQPFMKTEQNTHPKGSFLLICV